MATVTEKSLFRFVGIKICSWHERILETIDWRTQVRACPVSVKSKIFFDKVGIVSLNFLAFASNNYQHK